MIACWMIFGEAKRRWVPTQEVYASYSSRTTSGLCPSGASHRHTLAPSGPRLAFCSGAALQAERAD